MLAEKVAAIRWARANLIETQAFMLGPKARESMLATARAMREPVKSCSCGAVLTLMGCCPRNEPH